MTHWELAIEQDGGTISIDSFDKMEDALDALSKNDNPSAFIDLWLGTKELGQTFSKNQLEKLNK